MIVPNEPTSEYLFDQWLNAATSKLNEAMFNHKVSQDNFLPNSVRFEHLKIAESCLHNYELCLNKITDILKGE